MGRIDRACMSTTRSSLQFTIIKKNDMIQRITKVAGEDAGPSVLRDDAVVVMSRVRSMNEEKTSIVTVPSSTLRSSLSLLRRLFTVLSLG